MNHSKALQVLNNTYRKLQSLNGAGVPDDIKASIATIINGEHLTFRYMLFTAMLAKVCDSKVHPRAVQAQAKLDGAYDARSLCHKVIVPFEKSKMEGRLGDSNEPYLNKPARCETIDKGNPVRAGRDYKLLCCLYDLLEKLQGATPELHCAAFEYAFSLAMKRPVRQLSSIVLPEITTTTADIIKRLITFIKASYEGEAPVAVLGAILQFMYPLATVMLHPANEAGSSSNEVGDIDIIFPDKSLYAVEVKDKPYTDTDINHAVGKVKAEGHSKAIFAYGMNCGVPSVQYSRIVVAWAREGVDLSFASVEEALKQFIALCGGKEYSRLLQKTLRNLYCMRAKDGTIRDFKNLFGLQG